MGLEAKISSGGQKKVHIPLSSRVSRKVVERTVGKRIENLIRRLRFSDAKALQELYDNKARPTKQAVMAVYKTLLNQKRPDFHHVASLEETFGIPLPKGLAALVYKSNFRGADQFYMKDLDTFAARHQLDGYSLRREAVIEDFLTICGNPRMYRRKRFRTLLDIPKLATDKRVTSILQQAYRTLAKQRHFFDIHELSSIFNIVPRFSKRFVQECADGLVEDHEFNSIDELAELSGSGPVVYSRKTIREVSLAAARQGDIKCLNDMVEAGVPISLSHREVQRVYRTLQASGSLFMLNAATEKELGKLPDDMLREAAESYLKLRRNKGGGIYRFLHLATSREARVTALLPPASIQAAYRRYMRRGYTSGIVSLYNITRITPDISPDVLKLPNQERTWRAYANAILTIVIKEGEELDLSKQHPDVISRLYEHAFNERNVKVLRIMNASVGVQPIPQTVVDDVYRSLIAEEKFEMMATLAEVTGTQIPAKVHTWIRKTPYGSRINQLSS
ncbi:hypothetical protein HYS47_02560 [Candidatus Woesearchaeota archaeon]|nr:hypothetical protein [Candidatus Woesearchaeota archaeon]